MYIIVVQWRQMVTYIFINIGSANGFLPDVPRGRLNIKMWSYQYRDSDVKDKTVSSTI